MKGPLISIVVPIYNAEEYLDRCLRSILKQNFHSFEVVLVDDGCTDASSLICERYSSTDSRFRLIRQSHSGVSAARNAGLNLCAGKYIMFVDADDELPEGSLSVLAEGNEDHDLVLGGYIPFFDNLPAEEVLPRRSYSYTKDEIPLFFEENASSDYPLYGAPWAKLYKRKLIKTYFKSDLSHAEGKLFFLEYLCRCRSVRTIAEPLYVYNMRPDSIGNDNTSDEYIKQLFAFLPEYDGLITRLTQEFPDSSAIAGLYHNDLIENYIFKILNIFRKRNSVHLNKSNISLLYSYLSKDEHLNFANLPFSQSGNLLLYKIGKLDLSVYVYKFFAKFLGRKDD